MNKKKIKIAYVITAFDIGGAEATLRDLVLGLDTDRYEAVVISLLPKGAMAFQAERAGARVLSLHASKSNPLVLFQLVRMLRKELPDIVHTQLFHADILGRFAARLAGIPFVVSTLQNVTFGGLLRERLLAWTRGLVSVHVAVAQVVADHAIKKHLSKKEGPVLIYNSVRLPVRRVHHSEKRALRAKLGMDPAKKILVTTGRLVAQKGFNHLIQAVKLLVERHKAEGASGGVQLVILGGGEESMRAALAAQAAELPDQTVVLTGAVLNVDEYLAAADAFVMSSSWEGFSVALIEAGAAGLPVVATPVGIAPELIRDGENGILMDTRNPMSMAEKIHQMVTLSDEERAALGDRLREDVEKTFSVERMVRTYQALYEDLLARRPLAYVKASDRTHARKRLLIITTTDAHGGAEKSIMDILRLIDRKAFECRVVFLTHAPNGNLVDRVRAMGIVAECIGIQSKWQFFKLARLITVFRESRPDVVESFLFFDNLVARVFGALFKVPVIISGQQNAYLKRGFLRNLADRITMPLADIVISNSEAGKRWYADRGYAPSQKIHVLRSGIDMQQLAAMQAEHKQYSRRDQHDHRDEGGAPSEREIFGVHIPADAYAAFSIGFLTEQKGFSYLIRAARILKDCSVPVHFFIVGEGVLRPELEAFVSAEDVSDCIHFLGFRENAAAYLPLFDLFVLSSLWEGMPNVVIEAMASRVPVVATDVGGVGELLNENTGVLVRPGDSKILADGIRRMIELPTATRDAMIEGAYREILEHNTVEQMVRGREKLYEKILEQKLGKG